MKTGRGFCSALCGCQALCRVTAWEVLKFHSVTAFDTIAAAARLQPGLIESSVELSQLEEFMGAH